MRVAYFLAILLFSTQIAKAQSVDYSVTSVEEEKGLELTKVSSDNDYVVMPEVKRNNHSVNWWMGHVIQLSPNGKDIAYLSARNSTVNVYVKSISGVGSSLQRTNRQQVLDFSYSPDGKKLCFVESNGNDNRIFVTDANQGYVCRLITSGDNNYSPVFSADMKTFSSLIWRRKIAQASGVILLATTLCQTSPQDYPRVLSLAKMNYSV